MTAVVLFIPGLVFGIAGAVLQRTPFSWIALLISMIPTAVVGLEGYSIYQYETVEKPKAADTHHVLYSDEELTKNADGSAARLRGGSGEAGFERTSTSGCPPKTDKFIWCLRVSLMIK